MSAEQGLSTNDAAIMATPPPSPWNDTTLCPDWVVLNNSNVHVAKHRGWFKTYTPFESILHPLYVGVPLPVIGIGTVELVTWPSPNPHARHTLVLQEVLHVPRIHCNVIGTPILEKGYKVKFTCTSESKGTIRDKISAQDVAFFEPDHPLFNVKVSPPQGYTLRSTAFERGQAYAINCHWREVERERWNAYKEDLVIGMTRDFLCPDWVFMPSANAHVVKDCEWFTEYKPFPTVLKPLDNGTSKISVLGIGNVKLPTRPHPNSSVTTYIELHAVLYAPTNLCNVIGAPAIGEYAADCYTGYPSTGGLVTWAEGYQIACVNPNTWWPTLLVYPPPNHFLGPSIFWGDVPPDLHSAHGFWPEGEQVRFITFESPPVKQDEELSRSEPLELTEYVFLNLHFGGEKQFLNTRKLDISKVGDREEARAFLRALMRVKTIKVLKMVRQRWVEMSDSEQRAIATTVGESASDGDASEPSVSEPSASGASAGQASASRASTSRASAVRASAIRASASRHSASRPSTSQPSTSQPSTSQPSTSQPSTSEPSTSQPSISQPSANGSPTDWVFIAAIQNQSESSELGTNGSGGATSATVATSVEGHAGNEGLTDEHAANGSTH